MFESGISLGLLYLIYWLFLRKETFFFMNRIYLLFSIIISFIIPLINFTFSPAENPGSYYLIMDTIVIRANGIGQTIEKSISSSDILSIIYCSGVIILLIKFLIQIFQIFLLKRKSEIKKENGINLVITNKNISPCSFFNMIFLNTNISKTYQEKIVIHEHIHIKQLHSADLIFMKLLTIFQWFNPFVWMIKYSIQEIHEYLADKGVLNQGYSSYNYITLIVSQITGKYFFQTGNYFNRSLIKKRINMMKKFKSHGINKLKILLIIPAIIVLFIIFACSKQEIQSEDGNEPIKNDELTEAQISNVPIKSDELTEAEIREKEPVFTIVEEMPKFKSGDQNEFREYLQTILKYPEEAANKGIAGTVYINFVVNSKGEVKDAKVIRGIHPDLDAEVIRVIESSPKWTPGIQRGKKVNVQFTFPIKFILE